jgi:uncharacterized membrane protein YidH (DUF202 family)
MGWLLGLILASVVFGALAVHIAQFLFAGAPGWLLDIAKAGVFVITWTTTTAWMGMRAFTGKVRQLRQRNAAVRVRLDALTRGERR